MKIKFYDKEELKKIYLHWKWKRGYKWAWRIAEHKAKGYHEDISTCNPWYYFKNELDGLKGIYQDEDGKYKHY